MRTQSLAGVNGINVTVEPQSKPHEVNQVFAMSM